MGVRGRWKIQYFVVEHYREVDQISIPLMNVKYS